MKTEAAVLVEPGKPLEIFELTIPELGDGQVLVALSYSGVCHTQVMEARGDRGHDPWCPHCLGHEGTGMVVDIGAEVTTVQVGDRVVVSWIAGRGQNAGGAVYKSGGRDVNAGPATTFSRHAVIAENRVRRLPDDIAMTEGVLLGCAAPTGFGSIRNVCQLSEEDRVVVFGAGGVGICAIAAAAHWGCAELIAVDILDHKLALAEKFGAGTTINAATEDAVEQLKIVAPGGVDFAVVSTGEPSVMSSALEIVRPRGGTVVVIGNAKKGNMLELDPGQLNMGKKIVGTWGGDGDPDADLALNAGVIRSAAFKSELLLAEGYGLEDINQAIADLAEGRVGRPIISLAD